jgi:hypothetical protein
MNLRVSECRRGVDRDDPRVRDRAAQHRPVQHPGQEHVVEVGALPADEPLVLLAPQSTEADRAFLNGGHHRALLQIRVRDDH